MVIDLFGLDAESARRQFPSLYQWVLQHVKPERDTNSRASRREKWWLFGETNPKLRTQLAGLSRYIATVETPKHRTFQFLSASILPDNMITVIASQEALVLGVLSSRLHFIWATSSGGSLGSYIGNIRYNKTRCFEPFAFPDLASNAELAIAISDKAEEIDALRKARQAEHEGLSLTDMYNVLDALRLSRPLTAKEKDIQAQGLVGVLAELHDQLDLLVFEAYGWSDLGTGLIGKPGATLPWAEKPISQTDIEEQILIRLVSLNSERSAEESRGQIRWLRPDFQDPTRKGPRMPSQASMDLSVETPAESESLRGDRALEESQRNWPVGLPEQIRAVASILSTNGFPITIEDLENSFNARGRWRDRLPTILDTLEAIGRVRRISGKIPTWQWI